MEYFAWRNAYKVDGYFKTDSFNEHFPWTCKLCAKAQNPKHKVYESLVNFRDQVTHCGIREEVSVIIVSDAAELVMNGTE